MKKIYKGVWLLLGLAGAFAACRDMDDNYKDYIVNGGITYPGKPQKVSLHPGNNRAMLQWLKGTDPKVVKARIFWNNYTDSVELDMPSKGDTVNYTFATLPEGDYTFNIRTYDEKNNASIPVEISGRVFGATYGGTLLNRPVSASELAFSGSLKIGWGSPDTVNGAFAMEVKYINVAGAETITRFGIKETNTEITDFKPGGTYEFRTLFLPDSLAIDTFYTPFQLAKNEFKLAKQGWIAYANSFEPSGQQPNGAPTKILDDNAETYWHSVHTSPSPRYPHWVVVGTINTVELTRVELTSRSSHFREDFTAFRLEGSMDGNTWTEYGSFTQAEITGPQSFAIPGKPQAKFIRIYMTAGPTIHSHMAEFSAFGNYVQ
ncbi:DUF4998 domain-containing protein [uncultured Chitinophaga sp.]|uniref:DUF4998 domain-containing protein n=1 Tax=uncultured Chitinophaga sp. TaxID=339340 RepID=UPI0025E6D8C8|nr:DUF4998 domain-containing protein [uncultured Chitinophaga sp.]